MSGRTITLKDVFKCRPFLIMWTAMFTSTIGTFLLLLVLAAQVFEKTHSSFDAGMIFAAQWLLPVILFSYIGKIASKFNIQRTLASSQVAGGLISLVIGLLYSSPLIVIILLLSFRGLFEAITKTTREVAFKAFIPTELQAKASSLFESSYYLGTGFGGLLGAYLIGKVGITAIALVDSTTFIIAAFFYASLKNLVVKEEPESADKSWKLGIRHVRGNRQLFSTFSFLLLNVIIFQGLHNVARTVLPIQQLKLGMQGTQYLQIIFCLAITLATLLFAKYQCDKMDIKWSAWWRVLFTGLFLLCSAYSSSAIIGLSFYFLFAFQFEMSFLRHKTDMRLLCSKESIGHVSALFHSFAHLGMIVTILIFGKSSDWFGFPSASTGLFVIAALIAFILSPKSSGVTNSVYSKGLS